VVGRPDAPLTVALAWIEAHCVVPDTSPDDVQMFELTPEQLRFLGAHYLVKGSAKVGQKATAFVYRRSQCVAPQKAGKSPLEAAQVCLEAVGPALFGGFAEGGEVYDCAEHGCGCRFVHEYLPGEPMGMSWLEAGQAPLIQITATSEEQTDNIYDALRPMIERGPLAEIIPKTGEEFIRLPGGGRIDAVTSNARSRLGQRVTFVPQDETGVWTPSSGMVKVAETQRRGLAGMGGRAVEITNAWDPAEESVAQRTAESLRPDIYRQHVTPPANLSYGDKRQRHKIHQIVYAGWWGARNLGSIEAEAAELLEKDPAQAERFFGNRVVQGSGAWMPDDLWGQAYAGAVAS
jgi:hypothetical protein